MLAMLLLLLLAFSCSKFDELNQVEDGEYEAEFAIPLFRTETTLKSILDNLSDSTFVTLDSDGLINLNYSGSLIARTSEQLFNLFSLGAFEVSDTNYNVPFELPNSIDVNLVTFKEGTVVFNFKSLHEQDVDVKFTIPQLYKDGQPFTKTFSVDYDGSVPIEKTGAFSIVNHDLISPDNTISIIYEAIKADGQRDTLTDVIMAFANFEVLYAEGFLGTDIYEIGMDTIKIDFFEDWITGDIYFENPQINLSVINSFGFPIRSLFYYINVLTVDSLVLPLESIYINNLDSGFLFNYPTLDEVGETKVTDLSFNNTNSNIAEVLGSGPLEVRYHIDAIANPTNEDETDVGFLTCDSRMRVQIDVELPIHGQASGFAAFDTLKLDTFDLNVDFKEYGAVDWAEFKLVCDNGLPLDVFTQVHFLDENDQVIDSLLNGPQNIVAAAPVDANGIVIEPLEKITYINMTKDRFDLIRTAKKMLLTTLFYSYNNGTVPVKVYATDAVSIRMGAKVGVHN